MLIYRVCRHAQGLPPLARSRRYRLDPSSPACDPKRTVVTSKLASTGPLGPIEPYHFKSIRGRAIAACGMRRPNRSSLGASNDGVSGIQHKVVGNKCARDFAENNRLIGVERQRSQQSQLSARALRNCRWLYQYGRAGLKLMSSWRKGPTDVCTVAASSST